MYLESVLLPLLVLSTFGNSVSACEAPVSRGYAPVPGGKLYYEMAGKGPVLVLIAGGSGMDLRQWDDQFQDFARSFRVIRYDPRGIGRSDMPTEPFSYVEDLNSLLDFLGIEKAYLTGVSFGGGMAIDFALTHPGKVAALVAVAPALSGYQLSDDFQQRVASIISAWQQGGVEALVKAMLEDPYLLPAPANPQARKRAATLWRENTKHLSIQPGLVGSIEPPAIGRLAEIRVPTLLVLGDRDHPELYTVAKLLEEGITGVRKVSIAQAGHTPNMENPGEFNRVVLEFLDGLQKR